LLTNAWQGLRRTGALPTAAVILISITALLLVVGNVGVVAFPHIFSSPSSKHANSAAKHRTISILGSSKDSSAPNKNLGKNRTKQKSSNTAQQMSDQPSSPKPAENTNVYPNKGSGTTNVAPNLILAQLQCSTNQSGVPVYSAASAALTFSSPLASDENLAIKIETASDSGTPPDPSTVVLAQTSQTASAGATNVALNNQANPSQPLISAPSITGGDYKFRLDVTVNGNIIVVSDWISVPVASTPCAQN
jgi:hypothetical protein